MFDLFNKSLRNKLVVTLLAIGFVPFLILLVYTLFLSETKIVNKITYEQLSRANVVTKLINNDLASLQKEVLFISSLDLMDDILAEDIDKRIARLLIQKSKDIGNNNLILATNVNGGIISSSNASQLHTARFDVTGLTQREGSFIRGKTYYAYSKIFSSFDKNQSIGFLILEYDLNNLDMFLTHQNSIHSYILNPKENIYIGEEISLPVRPAQSSGSIIDKNHLTVYQNISSTMKDWYIVYAVDRDVALAFLYDFIKFMLYISILILLFILYFSFKVSKGIVRPIEELTHITDNIVHTHNYTAQINIHTQDEIAILSHSFNNMLQTTSFALDKLEEESKTRLQRFIQLIEIFNTIIKTQNEDECINTSLNEIKLLTKKQNLKFQRDSDISSNNQYISLHVTNFDDNSSIYLGTIDLGFEHFSDENEKKFYHSIANMIILQLDRIRLINKTMSASKAKSAFISNMSHELRTPLNAIIGFSQYLITYEELEDDQKEVVGNIESSAHYLLEMINEILDIAKIEAGKMDVHAEETDILELTHSVHKMLHPLADDKGLAFDFDTEKFHHRTYMTDPKMFKQIIINLLSNAIKFTKEGYIHLSLSNENGNLLFSVKDSGIGISKENLELLFNDFTQVENVMQKQHKGTGLGLSLSKKLANILGGDVTLSSEGEGFGTISQLILDDYIQ